MPLFTSDYGGFYNPYYSMPYFGGYSPVSVTNVYGGYPPAQGVYVVRDGAVELVHDDEVVAVLEPGEVFGHPSLLSGRAPAFTVRAREPSGSPGRMPSAWNTSHIRMVLLRL